MAVVPDFLIRRLYKKGSLKKVGNQITFMLKNVLGPGFISGFNYVKINDVTYKADKVKFLTQGKEILGEDVSEGNQVSFRMGQEGMLVLTGTDGIQDGKNRIEIEVMNPEAGKVGLTTEDTATFEE